MPISRHKLLDHLGHKALSLWTRAIICFVSMLPAAVMAQGTSTANYIPLGASAVNNVSVAWFIDVNRNMVVACAFPIPSGYPGPQFQPSNIKCGSALYNSTPTPPSPVPAKPSAGVTKPTPVLAIRR
jgi:hypothetical protein